MKFCAGVTESFTEKVEVVARRESFGAFSFDGTFCVERAGNYPVMPAPFEKKNAVLTFGDLLR